MFNTAQNFKSNGYTEGPALLKKEEILNLRNILESVFKSKGYPKTIFLSDIKDKEVIKKILTIYDTDEIKDFILNLSKVYNEEVFFLPRFLIQRNYHIDRLKSASAGWHRDCGGELKYDYCKKKLSSNSYVFGKLGIYLQENSLYGGSIDLIPNSDKYIKLNKFFLRKINSLNLFLIIKLQKFFPRIYAFFPENFFMRILKAKRLYPKIGSFVMFDSRVVHRGTPIDDSVRKNVSFNSAQNSAEVKNEFTKFSLYVDVGSKLGLDSYLHDRNQREAEIKEVDKIKEELNLLEIYLPKFSSRMQNIFSHIVKKYS